MTLRVDISACAKVKYMPTDDVRVLTTEREIAAYLHRTRMEILEVLRSGAATSSQIAARLGVHPANLTRHIRQLEAAGLLVLVEKRDTGRNLEKYYATVADRFTVVPDTSHLAEPHAIALAFAHSQLSTAVARLPERVNGPVAALTVGVRLRPEAARAFADELVRLAERLTAADDAQGQPYEVVMALVPGEGVGGARRQAIRLRAPEGRSAPEGPSAPGVTS